MSTPEDIRLEEYLARQQKKRHIKLCKGARHQTKEVLIEAILQQERWKQEIQLKLNPGRTSDSTVSDPERVVIYKNHPLNRHIDSLLAIRQRMMDSLRPVPDLPESFATALQDYLDQKEILSAHFHERDVEEVRFNARKQAFVRECKILEAEVEDKVFGWEDDADRLENMRLEVKACQAGIDKWVGWGRRRGFIIERGGGDANA